MKNTALQANSSDDMTKMQVSLDNYSLNLEIHLYKLGHIKFEKTIFEMLPHSMFENFLCID